MKTFKALVAALILAASATSALSQPAISELGAFEAQYPNRDPLNGGALTPAGRLGLELPDGAYPVRDSFGAISADIPAGTKRPRAYTPTTEVVAPDTAVVKGGCVRAPDIGEFAGAPWSTPPCEPIARY